jgi:hypothetical protein
MLATRLLLVAGFFLVGAEPLRAADPAKKVEPERDTHSTIRSLINHQDIVPYPAAGRTSTRD